jgi:hypothetical protein
MNAFSGIISTDLKTLHSNMISAMLYDDACTIPCTLNYGITKYEDCENCSYDSIGQKSANRYVSGGPVPFPFGTICPMCDGRGKRGVETSESINLMVIWNYKEFINVGTVYTGADDMIQVITFDENIPHSHVVLAILILYPVFLKGLDKCLKLM